MIESRGRGVLVPRRSLSSGAHSRDPVAGMTIVCGAVSASFWSMVRSCAPENPFCRKIGEDMASKPALKGAHPGMTG
jgi:hypothetical protein